MSLSVNFDVPPAIHAGLTNGSLERIGGVIRDAENKRVVAWLHEAAIPGQGNNPDGLINSVIHTSRRGAAVVSMGAAAHMLNLGISGATLGIMIQRFNDLSAQVEQVLEEFSHDRYVAYTAALQAAQDASKSNDRTFITQSVTQAVKGLFEAQSHFLRDVDKALEKKPRPDLNSAHHALLQAMHAATIRTRCYLIADEKDRALETLNEAIPIFEDYTRELIRVWLGQYPAIYLHPTIPPQVTERFLALQLRLRDDLTGDRASQLLALIHDLRQDFWNPKALDQLNPDTWLDAIAKKGTLITNSLKQLRQQKAETATENARSGTEILHEALIQAEIMLENFERLLGIELEIREMRLSSFREWDTLVDNETGQQEAIIVDEEMLARVSRLSM